MSEFDDDENKWIVLLDDNVLGCSSRVDILKDLVNRGKPFTYKQGLDIRLMNDEVANLLVDASYLDDYYFAFDNYADRDVIVPKLADWMSALRDEVQGLRTVRPQRYVHQHCPMVQSAVGV